MKIKKLLLLVIVLAFATTAGTVSAAEQLRVGVEGAYPPFSWKEADGSLKGFDIEFADFDGDGRDDLYFAARGTTDKLLLRRP